MAAKHVSLDCAHESGHLNRETALSALTRFLGDSPFRVILKLLVVSFLVGLVMNAFGWSPMDVFYSIQKFFMDLWNLGFHAIDRFLGYILLGAAIVVPAFILLRIANYRK
jgi:hypothetical protein